MAVFHTLAIIKLKLQVLQGNAIFCGMVSMLGASIYAFIFSYVSLIVIDKITPVRTTEQEETEGLDAALHGEEAYV